MTLRLSDEASTRSCTGTRGAFVDTLADRGATGGLGSGDASGTCAGREASSTSSAMKGIAASSCHCSAARFLRRQKNKDAAKTRINPAAPASQGQRIAGDRADGAASAVSAVLVGMVEGSGAGKDTALEPATGSVSGAARAASVPVAAGDGDALPVGLGVARAGTGADGFGEDTLGVAVGVATGGCTERSVGRGEGRTVGKPRGVMKIPSSTSIGPCGILVGVGVGEGGGSWKSRTDPGDAATGPARDRLASAVARIGKEIERVINCFRASQRAR